MEKNRGRGGKHREFFLHAPLWVPGLSPEQMRAVEIPASRKPKEIVCLPTPGKDGIEWVPDFFGLTKFG